MKLYELTYKYAGTDVRLYNIGKVSLKPNIPFYLWEDELPISLADLMKLKDIVIKEAALTIKPKQELVEAKARGSAGIVWEGASPLRATNYGDFKRGVVDYSKSAEVVETLSKYPGFRKISE